MSRIMFLLDYITIESSKDAKFTISPSQLLQLQTNGRTEASKHILRDLIDAKYHHFPVGYLVNQLIKLSIKLKEQLKTFKTEEIIIKEGDNFPIIIDEAQLFCPNKYNLLSGKLTMTRYSTSRSNDILALFLDAYEHINNNHLIVTGTAFSSELLKILQSSSGKQDVDTIIAIVGQSLIETKNDLCEKLKTVMNITDELQKFINTSIQRYLPIRRRMFTLALSNILKNNQNTIESFEKAFDDSMKKAAEKIRETVENLKPDKFTLQVLKFHSMYNLAAVDDNRLGTLLPSNLENMIDFFITSGVVPYRTDPYHTSISNRQKLSKSNVLFDFTEPLCRRITKDLCKDTELDDNFFTNVLASLTPKSYEKNENFDVAFPVAILGRLTGTEQTKIKDLPFFKIAHCGSMGNSDKEQTNFQKNYAIFSKSNCDFKVTAFICENSIKKFLAGLQFDQSIQVDQSISVKVNNILADTKKKKVHDWIYWEMFSDNDLFKLLVGVCYLPSINAHPDCWVLTQIKDGPLTRDNCGFISFAMKLHRDASYISQENVKNTYQSSMEYIYSTKKAAINTIEQLQCKSLLDLKIKTNESCGNTNDPKFEKKLLSIPETYREIRESAFSLPNLPITASLSYNKQLTIYEEAHNHALQITSSNIDTIFPDAYEIIFNGQKKI